MATFRFFSKFSCVVFLVSFISCLAFKYAKKDNPELAKRLEALPTYLEEHICDKETFAANVRGTSRLAAD